MKKCCRYVIDIKIFKSRFVPKRCQNVQTCVDHVFHERGFSFQLFIWLAYHIKMKLEIQDTEYRNIYFSYCIIST